MMTTEILKAVKTLADLIKEDKKYAAVTEAEKEYNENSEISTAMTEYSVQQQALTNEYAKEDRDTALCEAIQNRINELYRQIIANPAYEKYKAASDEYQAFYQAITEELDFQLTGKKASCTGDCSSCGGCH